MPARVTGFPFSWTSAPMYDGSSLLFVAKAIGENSPVGLLLAAWVYVVYALARAAEEYVGCLSLCWMVAVSGLSCGAGFFMCLRGGVFIEELAVRGGAMRFAHVVLVGARGRAKWGDGVPQHTDTGALCLASGVRAHPTCACSVALLRSSASYFLPLQPLHRPHLREGRSRGRSGCHAVQEASVGHACKRWLLPRPRSRRLVSDVLALSSPLQPVECVS